MEYKLNCGVFFSLLSSMDRNILSFIPHVFHPILFTFIHKRWHALLSPLLRVYHSLNFWPQDPVRTSPTYPVALKNRLSQNITLLHTHRIRPWRHTSTECVYNVCVTAYLCLHRCSVESQSAQARAHVLHSFSGSETSPQWGNCTLQHKQPISADC